MEAGMIPRTTVRTTDATPARSTPSDSTRLVLAARSLRGGLGPVSIASPRALARRLERSGVGIDAWDAVDVALREGVPEVIFCRIVGEDALPASIELDGPGNAPALIVTANEVGEFGNGSTGGYTAQVILGPNGAGERQVVIRRAGQELTRSPVFTARAQALAWNARQDVVTVSLGSENAQPVVAIAANFTGGTDDGASLGASEVTAALERAKRDLGPAQVVAPGFDDEATNTALLTYAQDFHRTALIELADGLEVGDLVDEAGALRALGSGAEGLPRLGGSWTQGLTGPGVLPNTTRTVPATVGMAGLIARLEAQEGHPNVAPFGDFGGGESLPWRWATGATRYFSEADAETVYAAGVNVLEEYLSSPRNATFHTLEDPDVSEWSDLAHTRVERVVRAIGFDVGRKMGSRRINRSTINEFGAAYRVELERLRKAGGLNAFRVDTDSANDLESMRAKEVNASVGFQPDEHAEFVNIDLAKVPTGQEV